MDTAVGKSILPFKVQELTKLIMLKKKMSFVDALYYLYSTELYTYLADDSAKFWYLGSHRLYEMIEDEKRSVRKKETSDSKLSLFLVFCIESYKEYKEQTAEEVLSLFLANGVFNYLKDVFDVLHTQSKAYIVSEIDAIITAKNNNK